MGSRTRKRGVANSTQRAHAKYANSRKPMIGHAAMIADQVFRRAFDALAGGHPQQTGIAAEISAPLDVAGHVAAEFVLRVGEGKFKPGDPLFQFITERWLGLVAEFPHEDFEQFKADTTCARCDKSIFAHGKIEDKIVCADGEEALDPRDKLVDKADEPESPVPQPTAIEK